MPSLVGPTFKSKLPEKFNQEKKLVKFIISKISETEEARITSESNPNSIIYT